MWPITPRKRQLPSLECMSLFFRTSFHFNHRGGFGCGNVAEMYQFGDLKHTSGRALWIAAFLSVYLLHPYHGLYVHNVNKRVQ